jgi:hypothetical protein
MSKKPFREHQSIRITQPVKADFEGSEPEPVILPAGTSGAIIFIGNTANPESYLIEFRFCGRDDSALATVPAEFVEPKYTPEEEAVLAQYAQRANEAEEEVRAFDPAWRGPNYWAGAKRSPTFAEWVKHLEDVAAAAQARLKELRG